VGEGTACLKPTCSSSLAFLRSWSVGAASLVGSGVGPYGRIPCQRLAPRLIFEDSSSSLNSNSTGREPCSQRALMQLLPGARAPNKIHTSISRSPPSPEPLDSLYRAGTQQEIEAPRSARGSRSDQAAEGGMQRKRPPSIYVSRRSPKHSCLVRLTVWLKRRLDQPCACYTSLAIRPEVPAYRPHTQHQIQV
jgi:hypothetical protein